jgi:hypothetical protein
MSEFVTVAAVETEVVVASAAGADLAVYTVAAAVQTKDSPQHGMVC